MRGKMRKIKETEAHRARTAILEGRFPEGMQARCAWCGKVGKVGEGEFVDRQITAAGPGKVFKCSECRQEEGTAA
jgi:hypothetical protein